MGGMERELHDFRTWQQSSGPGSSGLLMRRSSSPSTDEPSVVKFTSANRQATFRIVDERFNLKELLIRQ